MAPLQLQLLPPRRRGRPLAALLLLLLALLALTLVAPASAATWRTAASGLASVAGNWQGSTPPTDGSDIALVGGYYVVTLDLAITNFGVLSIPKTFNGSLSFTTSVTFTKIQWFGGTLNATIGKQLYVNGSFDLSQGTARTLSNLTAMHFGSSANWLDPLFTLDSAAFIVNGTVSTSGAASFSGTGRLEVANYGRLTSTSDFTSNGAAAQLVVSNGGTFTAPLLTTNGPLSVNAGGTLTVTDSLTTFALFSIGTAGSSLPAAVVTVSTGALDARQTLQVLGSAQIRAKGINTHAAFSACLASASDAASVLSDTVVMSSASTFCRVNLTATASIVINEGAAFSDSSVLYAPSIDLFTPVTFDTQATLGSPYSLSDISGGSSVQVLAGSTVSFGCASVSAGSVTVSAGASVTVTCTLASTTLVWGSPTVSGGSLTLAGSTQLSSHTSPFRFASGSSVTVGSGTNLTALSLTGSSQPASISVAGTMHVSAYMPQVTTALTVLSGGSFLVDGLTAPAVLASGLFDVRSGGTLTVRSTVSGAPSVIATSCSVAGTGVLDAGGAYGGGGSVFCRTLTMADGTLIGNVTATNAIVAAASTAPGVVLTTATLSVGSSLVLNSTSGSTLGQIALNDGSVNTTQATVVSIGGLVQIKCTAASTAALCALALGDTAISGSVSRLEPSLSAYGLRLAAGASAVAYGPLTVQPSVVTTVDNTLGLVAELSIGAGATLSTALSGASALAPIALVVPLAGGASYVRLTLASSATLSAQGGALALSTSASQLGRVTLGFGATVSLGVGSLNASVTVTLGDGSTLAVQRQFVSFGAGSSIVGGNNVTLSVPSSELSFADGMIARFGDSLRLNVLSGMSLGAQTGLEAGGFARVTLAAGTVSLASGSLLQLGDASTLLAGVDVSLKSSSRLTLGPSSNLTVVTGPVMLYSGALLQLGAASVGQQNKGDLSLDTNATLLLGPSATYTRLGASGTVSLAASANCTLGDGAVLTTEGAMTAATSARTLLGVGAKLTVGGTLAFDVGTTTTLGASAVVTASSDASFASPSTLALGASASFGTAGALVVGASCSVTLGAGASLAATVSAAFASRATTVLGASAQITSGGTLSFGTDCAPLLGNNAALRATGAITFNSNVSTTLGAGAAIVGLSMVTFGTNASLAVGPGGLLSAAGTLSFGDVSYSSFGASSAIWTSGSILTVGTNAVVVMGRGANVTSTVGQMLLAPGANVTLGTDGNVTVTNGGVTLQPSATLALGDSGTLAVASGGVSIGASARLSLGTAAALSITSGGLGVGASGAFVLGASGVAQVGAGGMTLGSAASAALGASASVTVASGAAIVGTGAVLTLGPAASLVVGASGVSLLSNALLVTGPNCVLQVPAGTIALDTYANVTLGASSALSSGGALSLATLASVTVGAAGSLNVAAGGIGVARSASLALGAGATGALPLGDIALSSASALSLGDRAMLTLSGGSLAMTGNATLALGANATLTLASSAANLTLSGSSGLALRLDNNATLRVPRVGGAGASNVTLALGARAQLAAFAGNVELGASAYVALDAAAQLTAANGTLVLGAPCALVLNASAAVTVASLALDSSCAVTLGSAAALTTTGGALTIGAYSQLTAGTGATVASAAALVMDANATLALGASAALSAAGAVTIGTSSTLTLASAASIGAQSGVLIGGGSSTALAALAAIVAQAGAVQFDTASTVALTGAGAALRTVSSGGIAFGTNVTVTLAASTTISAAASVRIDVGSRLTGAAGVTLAARGGSLQVLTDAAVSVANGSLVFAAAAAGGAFIGPNAWLSLGAQANATLLGPVLLLAGSGIALGANATLDMRGGLNTSAPSFVLAQGIGASVRCAGAACTLFGCTINVTDATANAGTTFTLGAGANGSALALGSRIAAFDAITIEAGAALRIDDTSSLSASRALAVQGSSSSLLLAGGSLAVLGSLNVSGAGANVTLASGTFAAAGVPLSVSGGAALGWYGPLQLSGATLPSGVAVSGGGSSFAVAGAVSWTAAPAVPSVTALAVSAAGGAQVALDARGVTLVPAPSAPVFGFALVLNDSATSASLAGGARVLASATVRDGASLSLLDASNVGAVVARNGASVLASGVVVIASAQFGVAGGTLQDTLQLLTTATTCAVLNSLTLAGSGGLSVTGAGAGSQLALLGTTQLGAPLVLNDARVLNNGTLTMATGAAGALRLDSNAAGIDNVAPGAFAVTCAAGAVWTYDGSSASAAVVNYAGAQLTLSAVAPLACIVQVALDNRGGNVTLSGDATLSAPMTSTAGYIDLCGASTATTLSIGSAVRVALYSPTVVLCSRAPSAALTAAPYPHATLQLLDGATLASYGAQLSVPRVTLSGASAALQQQNNGSAVAVLEAYEASVSGAGASLAIAAGAVNISGLVSVSGADASLVVSGASSVVRGLGSSSAQVAAGASLAVRGGAGIAAGCVALASLSVSGYATLQPSAAASSGTWAIASLDAHAAGSFGSAAARVGNVSLGAAPPLAIDTLSVLDGAAIDVGPGADLAGVAELRLTLGSVCGGAFSVSRALVLSGGAAPNARVLCNMALALGGTSTVAAADGGLSLNGSVAITLSGALNVQAASLIDARDSVGTKTLTVASGGALARSASLASVGTTPTLNISTSVQAGGVLSVASGAYLQLAGAGASLSLAAGALLRVDAGATLALPSSGASISGAGTVQLRGTLSVDSAASSVALAGSTAALYVPPEAAATARVQLTNGALLSVTSGAQLATTGGVIAASGSATRVVLGGALANSSAQVFLNSGAQFAASELTGQSAGQNAALGTFILGADAALTLVSGLVSTPQTALTVANVTLNGPRANATVAFALATPVLGAVALLDDAATLTVAGSQAVQLSGTLLMQRGTIGGDGVLQVNGGASAVFAAPSSSTTLALHVAQLLVQGSLTWGSGTLDSGASTYVWIQSGATATLATPLPAQWTRVGQAATPTFSAGLPSIYNQGTLTLATPAVADHMYIDVALTNEGQFTATRGTIEFYAPVSSTSAGTFDVFAPAVVIFHSTSDLANHTSTGGIVCNSASLTVHGAYNASLTEVNAPCVLTFATDSVWSVPLLGLARVAYNASVLVQGLFSSAGNISVSGSVYFAATSNASALGSWQVGYGGSLQFDTLASSSRYIALDSINVHGTVALLASTARFGALSATNVTLLDAANMTAVLAHDVSLDAVQLGANSRLTLAPSTATAALAINSLVWVGGVLAAPSGQRIGVARTVISDLAFAKQLHGAYLVATQSLQLSATGTSFGQSGGSRFEIAAGAAATIAGAVQLIDTLDTSYTQWLVFGTLSLTTLSAASLEMHIANVTLAPGAQLTFGDGSALASSVLITTAGTAAAATPAATAFAVQTGASVTLNGAGRGLELRGASQWASGSSLLVDGGAAATFTGSAHAFAASSSVIARGAGAQLVATSAAVVDIAAATQIASGARFTVSYNASVQCFGGLSVDSASSAAVFANGTVSVRGTLAAPGSLAVGNSTSAALATGTFYASMAGAPVATLGAVVVERGGSLQLMNGDGAAGSATIQSLSVTGASAAALLMPGAAAPIAITVASLTVSGSGSRVAFLTSGTAQVAQAAVSAGSLEADSVVSIGTSLAWTGGALNGSSRIELAGTLSATGSALQIWQAQLRMLSGASGTFSAAGQVVTFTSAGSLNVMSGASLSLEAPASGSSTLTCPDGTATSLTIAGAVTAPTAGGTLLVTGLGSLSVPGSLAATGTGAVVQLGTSPTVTGGRIAASGVGSSISVLAGAAPSVSSGGSLLASGPSSTVSLAGGSTLTSSAVLNATGVSASVSVAGGTHTWDSTAVVFASGPMASLALSGGATVSMAGAIGASSNATMSIAGGAQLTTTSTSALVISDSAVLALSGASSLLDSSGTLMIAGAAANWTVASAATATVRGSLSSVGTMVLGTSGAASSDVGLGSVQLVSGARLASQLGALYLIDFGSLTVSSGALLASGATAVQWTLVDLAGPSAALTFTPGALFSASTSIAQLSLRSSTALAQFSSGGAVHATTTTLTSGELRANSVVTLDSSLAWTGGTLSGASRFELAGTLSATGTALVISQVELRLLSGALGTFSAAGQVVTFTSAGSLNVMSGASLSLEALASGSSTLTCPDGTATSLTIAGTVTAPTAGGRLLVMDLGSLSVTGSLSATGTGAVVQLRTSLTVTGGRIAASGVGSSISVLAGAAPSVSSGGSLLASGPSSTVSLAGGSTLTSSAVLNATGVSASVSVAGGTHTWDSTAVVFASGPMASLALSGGATVSMAGAIGASSNATMSIAGGAQLTTTSTSALVISDSAVLALSGASSLLDSSGTLMIAGAAANWTVSSAATATVRGSLSSVGTMVLGTSGAASSGVGLGSVQLVSGARLASQLGALYLIDFGSLTVSSGALLASGATAVQWTLVDLAGPSAALTFTPGATFSASTSIAQLSLRSSTALAQFSSGGAVHATTTTLTSGELRANSVVTLDSSLAWTGGTLSGASRFELAGIMSATGAALQIYQVELRLLSGASGTFSAAGQLVTLASAGGLRVASGASLSLEALAPGSSTLRCTDASATFIAFEGTVTAPQSGTVLLTGLNSFTVTGSLAATGTGAVVQLGTSPTVTGGTVAASGTSSRIEVLAGAAPSVSSSGALLASGAGATVSLAGGSTLASSAALNATGASASISVVGGMHSWQSGSTVALTGEAVTLDVSAAANVSTAGTLLLGGAGALLRVRDANTLLAVSPASAALLAPRADASIVVQAAAALRVAGMLDSLAATTIGASATTTSPAVQFDMSGAQLVRLGAITALGNSLVSMPSTVRAPPAAAAGVVSCSALALYDTATVSLQPLAALAGTTLRIANGTLASSGAQLLVASSGPVVFDALQLWLGSLQVNSTVTAALLDWTTGTLSGVGGELDVQTAGELHSAATKSLAGTLVVGVLDGATLDWYDTGALTLSGGATVRVDAGAVLRLNGTWLAGASGRILAAGAMVLAPPATLVVAAGVAIESYGSLDIVPGVNVTLLGAFKTNGTLTAEADTTLALEGSSTWLGAALVNATLLRFGAGAAAAGTVLHTFAASAVLDASCAALECDAPIALRASASWRLNGTLFGAPGCALDTSADTAVVLRGGAVYMRTNARAGFAGTLDVPDAYALTLAASANVTLAASAVAPRLFADIACAGPGGLFAVYASSGLGAQLSVARAELNASCAFEFRPGASYGGAALTVDALTLRNATFAFSSGAPTQIGAAVLLGDAARLVFATAGNVSNLAWYGGVLYSSTAGNLTVTRCALPADSVAVRRIGGGGRVSITGYAGFGETPDQALVTVPLAAAADVDAAARAGAASSWPWWWRERVTPAGADPRASAAAARSSSSSSTPATGAPFAPLALLGATLPDTTLTLANSSALRVASGATLLVAAPLTLQASTASDNSSVQIDGTLLLAESASSDAVSLDAQLVVTSGGQINVSTGALAVLRSTAIDGVVVVDSAAASVAFSGAGNLFGGTLWMRTLGASATLGGTGSYELTETSLVQGPGDLTFTGGSSTTTVGTFALSGGGTLTVDASSALRLGDFFSEFVANATFSADVVVNDGGSLLVAGTYDHISGSLSIGFACCQTAVFTLQPGATVSRIGSSLLIGARGIINANSGSESGQFTLTRLQIAGGSANFNAGDRLALGTFDFSSGTFTMDSQIDVAGAMSWVAGTFIGSGDTIVNGPLTITTNTLKYMDSRRIIAQYNASWSGGAVRLKNAASIVNGLGSYFALQSGAAIQTLSNSRLSSLVNYGVMDVTSNGTVVTLAVPLVNYGTLRLIDQSTLRCDDTLLLYSGVMRLGNGTVVARASLSTTADVGVSVTSNATLFGPGTVAGTLANAGTLQLDGLVVVSGNYSQNTTGRLVVDLLAADNFGVLSVVGPRFAPSGELEVRFAFVPQNGSQFTILYFVDRIGDFLRLRGCNGFLAASYGAHNFTLRTVDNPSTDDVFVSPFGSDASCCGSQLNPCGTVLFALETVADGSTIRLFGGEYTGTGNYDLSFLGRSVTVRNVEGEAPTINCGGLGRGFLFQSNESRASVLDSITLRNCRASAGGSGGGILIQGTSPTLRDVVIEDAAADAAGGGVLIAAAGAAPLLDGVRVLRGSALNGGAIAVLSGAQPVLVGVTIAQSTASALGGGLYVSAANPSVTALVASGNGAPLGGGAYLTQCDALIADSLFVGNTASESGAGIFLLSANSTVRNTTFVGNVAVVSGGAVQARSSATDFIGCNMTGNVGRDGGAFVATFAATATLESTLFAANSAALSGGAVYVSDAQPQFTNCSFVDNTAGVSGGAAYIELSASSVYTSWFSGNSAARGGGLFLGRGATTAVRGCTLASNTATAAGGSVCVSFAEPTIDACNVTTSSAPLGGGVFIESSTGTLQLSSLTGNAATDGAALYVTSAANISVLSCNMSGNVASEFGGAMYSAAATLAVLDTNSSANAATSGAAVYTVSSDCSIDASALTANAVSDQGAGVYAVASTISARRTLMYANSAAASGAAVQLIASVGTLDTCWLSGNDAVRGGAAFVDSSTLVLRGTRLNSNHANEGGAVFSVLSTVLVADSLFDANLGDTRGGAFYCLGGSRVELNTSRFSSNQAAVGGAALADSCPLSVFSSRFDSNSAQQGAAIGCTTSSTPRVWNATFVQNTASQSGGAFYCTSCQSVMIAASTFFANRALTGGGGAVRLDTVALANVTGSNFTMNEALADRGGALKVSSSTLSLVGGTFTRNLALSGGAVDLSCAADACSVANSTFVDNVATSLGGGGIVWDAQPPQVHSSFADNVALYGPSIASGPVRVVIAARFNNSYVASNELLPGDIVAEIQDFYGNKIVTDNSTIVEARVLSNGTSVASLQGAASLPASSGSVVFSGLKLLGEPGTNHSIVLSATGLLSAAFDIGLRFCQVGETNETLQCKECARGTYNLNGDLVCRTCPNGAQCPGGASVLSNVDYWVLENGVTAAAYLCPSGFCLADNQCSTNRSGVLCGTCDPGTYAWGATCTPCAALNPLVATLVLIGGFAYVLFVVKFGRNSSGNVKILMYFVQTLQIALGPNAGLFSILAIFNLQFDDGGSGLCVAPFDFYMRSLIYLLLPLFLMVILMIVWLLHYVWRRFQCNRRLGIDKCLRRCRIHREQSMFDRRETPGVTAAAATATAAKNGAGTELGLRRARAASLAKRKAAVPTGPRPGESEDAYRRRKLFELRDQYVHALVFLFLFSYSTIAITSLSFVNCRTVGSDLVLAKSPDIDCRSDEYKSWVGLYYVMIGLIVIGEPIALLAMLIKLRYRLGEERYRNRFGSLYVCYKPNAYWWEVVFIVRRTVLIGTSVALYRSPETASFAIAIEMVALAALHIAVRPFASGGGNFVEGFSLVSLSLISIIEASVWSSATDTAQSSVTWLLIILIAVPAVFILCLIIFRFAAPLVERLRKRAAAKILDKLRPIFTRPAERLTTTPNPAFTSREELPDPLLIENPLYRVPSSADRSTASTLSPLSSRSSAAGLSAAAVTPGMPLRPLTGTTVSNPLFGARIARDTVVVRNPLRAAAYAQQPGTPHSLSRHSLLRATVAPSFEEPSMLNNDYSDDDFDSQL